MSNSFIKVPDRGTSGRGLPCPRARRGGRCWTCGAWPRCCSNDTPPRSRTQRPSRRPSTGTCERILHLFKRRNVGTTHSTQNNYRMTHQLLQLPFEVIELRVPHIQFFRGNCRHKYQRNGPLDLRTRQWWIENIYATLKINLNQMWSCRRDGSPCT